MANGLINKGLIMKAWTFLREKEMSIPNETLDFMREAALEKLALIENGEVLKADKAVELTNKIISNARTSAIKAGLTEEKDIIFFTHGWLTSELTSIFEFGVQKTINHYK